MANIFISYAHADEALKDRLEIHLKILKRQGLIQAWHDREILPGNDFRLAIEAALDMSDLILLLVSPDFLNSDYCYDIELQRALGRQKGGQATILPVILRPCEWRVTPFGHLLATPRDGKPVVMWPNIDEALHQVVTDIRRFLASRQSLP